MGSWIKLRRRMVVAAVGAAGVAATAMSPAYADPPIVTYPTAIAISNAGYVIGVAQQEGKSKVGVWNPAGQYTLLQTAADDQSDWAFAINGCGVIAGYRLDTGYTAHPALWNRFGKRTDLPTVSGGGEARAVNDKDVAVGDLVYEGIEYPVEWSKRGKITKLPLPSGATFGEAWAINDAGVVLGRVGAVDTSRSVLWYPDGRTVDLATPSGDIETFPAAINKHGDSVGFAYTPNYQVYAVRWNRDGRVTVLSTAQSQADSINDAGVVGGVTNEMYGGTGSAAEWSPDGRETLLPVQSTNIFSAANGINDRGVIVGFAVRSNGQTSGQAAAEWSANGRLTFLK